MVGVTRPQALHPRQGVQYKIPATQIIVDVVQKGTYVTLAHLCDYLTLWLNICAKQATYPAELDVKVDGFGVQCIYQSIGTLCM